MDTYLHRESLRDPSLRCLLPKSLKRRRPLPMSQAAAKGHANGRSARRYVRSYGYLHGIGLEPEDLDLLDEQTMFTSGTGS